MKLVLTLAVLALTAGLREAFVIDEDLVDELTSKRVHIRLYDAFVEEYDRRPDQAEYEDLIARYQARFRETGIHPRVEDIIPGEDDAEEKHFLVFYILWGIALVFCVAAIAHVVRSRGSRPGL